MTDAKSNRDVIAGFLDRDALGAPTWSTSQEGADQLLQLLQLPPAIPPGAPTIADYEEVLADHRRFVRRLDVALNGNAGAAKQASFCDIVEQAEEMFRQRHDATTTAASGQVVAEWQVRVPNQTLLGVTWMRASDEKRARHCAEQWDTEVRALYTHPAPSTTSVRAEALLLEARQFVSDRCDEDNQEVERHAPDLLRRIDALLQTPHASGEDRAMGSLAESRAWFHVLATTPAASGQAVAWRRATKHGWDYRNTRPTEHTPAGYMPLYTHPAPSAASVRAEADATRYRWLKEQGLITKPGIQTMFLDEFVDAQIALQTPHASGEGRADG